MEGTYLCGFTFFANFDSGNLARIEVDEEYRENNENCGSEPTIAESITKNVESSLDFSCERPTVEPPCDFAFKMWTRPDCSGTKYENGNRTWFYFGFKGGPIEHPNPETGCKGNLGTPQMLRISIMNLNKQSKLFSQGMVPISMRVPLASATGNLSKASVKQLYPQTWERLRERPSYYTNAEDNNFVLTIRIKSDPKAITYVAFTYPYSYKELQSYLGRLEKRFSSLDHSYEEIQSQSLNYVYFHRENLCYSLQKRRIDVITISGNTGILDERESNLNHLYPSQVSQSSVAGNSKIIEKNVKNLKNDIRSYKFHNKKAVFISARVHPGETQSSFVMRGFIKFLLRPNDPRAIMLRKKYVFKLIPMLNPDGVYQGHYRTDSNGVNLNRCYARPDLNLHPSIFAARKLLLYVHHGEEIEENFESETDEALTADEEVVEDMSQEESLALSDKCKCNKDTSNITTKTNNSFQTTVENRRDSIHSIDAAPKYIDSEVEFNINQHSNRSEDKFLEPSESLRIRRDSTRSGENIVTRSPSDSSPSSSTSSINSRWLRSHRKSTLESMHSHSSIGGNVTDPSSNISGVMNWYEMTETSRCSEGDESIADFSICHPTASSATMALAAAVGANTSKLNIHSLSTTLSQNIRNESNTQQHHITPPRNDGINSIKTVGNSSSFQRATSFEGAFSALSKKGNFNSSQNTNIHSTLQPLSLDANQETSPVRRLTFDHDLPAELESSSCKNKLRMDENFDSDDGLYVNRRNRTASSTSAFDQEEDANLDFATNDKSTNSKFNRDLTLSFPRGIANSHMPTTTTQINNYLLNTTNTSKVEETETNILTSTKTKANKTLKEEKLKIYNSLNNKNKIKSNLLLYVDIHGHASKRGIFMYGNHFSDMDNKIASMLLPKLMSINSANFDFPACNFTEKNMYMKDRHTGAGREGSGRVSAYKATGLVQAYTLECNFNTGRVVNCVPMASRDSGRATPPPPGTSNPELSSIPKYNPEIYEESGKAMAISILDLTEINPWTRLTCSACKNIKGVKEWLRKFIRHSEEQLSHKTPTKSPKHGGAFCHAHANSTTITSPVRALRSGSGSTRRARTFSATSIGGNNTSTPQNVQYFNNSSSRAGANSSKKMSRGVGPGSPGSYRPVSKIARKNSLNQQQSQTPSNFRHELASLSNVGNNVSNESCIRPKLSRSKSLTGLVSPSLESNPKPNKKLINSKEGNIKAAARKNLNLSNENNSNTKLEAARPRSNSKSRAAKPTRQQRSPVNKQPPTMKWSHNGTLITQSLPPPQVKKTANSSKSRSQSANQKKRKLTSLDKANSASSLNLSETQGKGSNSLPNQTKNTIRKSFNDKSTTFSQTSLINRRATSSIDVEKQILNLTGDTSSESSVLGSTYVSSQGRINSISSNISSGIGSDSSFSNITETLTTKPVAPSKKRRIKRKKPVL